MAAPKRDGQVSLAETQPAALTVPEGSEPSIALLLQTAIQSGLDPEGMTKLVELHERMEAKKAKRAFFDALRDFQFDCPPIRKTQEVQGSYSFAPFDQVVRTIKPYLSKHGFSFKHDTPEIPKDGFLVVEVTISHVGGHHEVSRFPVDIGTGTKLMSKAQIVSAAISFGRRNSLIEGLGLVMTNEDTDGAGVGNGLINENQIANIEAIRDEIGNAKAWFPKFLSFMGVASTDTIRSSDYSKAIRVLELKRKQGGEL